jgi:hypothetical protein
VDGVAAVVVLVIVGSGVSLVRVGWLSVGIGGKLGWTLLARGATWLEAVGLIGTEACGCMSTKPKQNTDMIKSGGPIKNRWELVICLESSIAYCAKVCPLKA